MPQACHPPPSQAHGLEKTKIKDERCVPIDEEVEKLLEVNFNKEIMCIRWLKTWFWSRNQMTNELRLKQYPNF